MAIKKIPVEKLKPQMYVSDLNSDWIPHGPKNREGKITKESIIEDIKKMGIKHVYIDTEKGIDENEGQDEREVEEERQQKFEKAGELPPSEKQPVTSLSEEMNRASKIHNQAKSLVDQALNNVKVGHAIDVDAIDDLSEQMVDSVFRNKDALGALGRIRNKDLYLMEHSVNLSVLMSTFGRHKNIPRKRLQEFAVGALLHDIGKVLVPDEILHKPGKLTPEEFEKIKMHAIFSESLLKETPGISSISIEVAAQHHERVDGSGYPHGLCGEKISDHGKMVAIIDVYDAITADRCYHKALPPSQALKKLLEWSGTHFDPTLVHEFIRSLGIYPIGSLVQLKSNRLGVVIQQNQEDQRQPVIKVIYNLKHKRFINVEELDLSNSKVEDEIVKALDPRKFGIHIGDFLQ